MTVSRIFHRINPTHVALQVVLPAPNLLYPNKVFQGNFFMCPDIVVMSLNIQAALLLGG